MIAKAARTYGFIVVDRGAKGASSDDEVGARPAPEQERAEQNADLVRILQALKLVHEPRSSHNPERPPYGDSGRHAF